MKSILRVITLLVFIFPFMLQAQAGKQADVEIFSDVLKTAEWASFKYMANIELAKKGDQKALKDLFEFSGTVDGVEALQHATTCIELISLAGDEKMGAVIYILKPKLKTVLLERFQLAIGRTKKEELRKPLQEWAPLTWKALNGEKVVCSTCLNGGDLTAKPPSKKPTANTTTDTEEPSSPKGKQ